MATNLSELPSPVAFSESPTRDTTQHLPAAAAASADNDHIANRSPARTAGDEDQEKSPIRPTADHKQYKSTSRAAHNPEPDNSSTQLNQGQRGAHNSGSDDTKSNSAAVQETQQEPTVSSTIKSLRSSTRKTEKYDFYKDAYRNKANFDGGADRIQRATAANARADIAGGKEHSDIRSTQEHPAHRSQPVDVVNRFEGSYRAENDAAIPGLRSGPVYEVNDKVRHLSTAEEDDEFGSRGEFPASRGGGREPGSERYHNALHGDYSVPVRQNDRFDAYAPRFDNFDDYGPYRGGQNDVSPQRGNPQHNSQQDRRYQSASQRPGFEVQPRHFDGYSTGYGESSERNPYTGETSPQYGRFDEHPMGFGAYDQSLNPKRMHRRPSIEEEPRPRQPFDENPAGFASRMLPPKPKKIVKAAVDPMNEDDPDNDAMEMDDGGEGDDGEYQPKAKAPKRGRGQARGRGTKAARAGRTSARGAKAPAAGRGRGRGKKPSVQDIIPDAPVRPNLKPMTRLTKPFSAEDFVNLAFRDEEDDIDPEPMQDLKRRRLDENGQHEVRPFSQRPPRTIHEGEFNDPGAVLPDSRYQGGDQPWNLNQSPPVVPSSEVSDAALLKRDLKRPRDEFVCKRSYGANDPENIAIVNLREYDEMNFTEICEEINNRRIESGKAPTLSVTGVTARYNRTAPLLFAARGEEFVPLAKRPYRNAPNGGKKTGFAWTSELDVELVNIFKEVDSERWKIIADIFRERTGEDVDYATIAKRYSQL